jgi:hypothetical protein
MTTTEKHPGSSPKASGFKDKTGNEIPADAFENEAGPPRDPAKTMTEKDLADFDAETERLKTSSR